MLYWINWSRDSRLVVFSPLGWILIEEKEVIVKEKLNLISDHEIQLQLNMTKGNFLFKSCL